MSGPALPLPAPTHPPPTMRPDLPTNKSTSLKPTKHGGRRTPAAPALAAQHRRQRQQHRRQRQKGRRRPRPRGLPPRAGYNRPAVLPSGPRSQCVRGWLSCSHSPQTQSTEARLRLASATAASCRGTTPEAELQCYIENLEFRENLSQLEQLGALGALGVQSSQSHLTQLRTCGVGLGECSVLESVARFPHKFQSFSYIREIRVTTTSISSDLTSAVAT